MMIKLIALSAIMLSCAAQTKPAEEQMIDSLIKGLQALGNSLSEDLANNPIHQDVKPIPKKPNPKQ